MTRKSPARSAAGNLRNFKAMGDGKLTALAEQMLGHTDTEAVDAIDAVIRSRPSITAPREGEGDSIRELIEEVVPDLSADIAAQKAKFSGGQRRKQKARLDTVPLMKAKRWALTEKGALPDKNQGKPAHEVAGIGGDPAGWWVSEKFDGLRAIWIPGGIFRSGGAELYLDVIEDNSGADARAQILRDFGAQDVSQKRLELAEFEIMDVWPEEQALWKSEQEIRGYFAALPEWEVEAVWADTLGQDVPDGIFISKSGNEFYAPPFFTENLPADHVLDGELWAGRNKFEMASSITRTQKDSKKYDPERWKKLKYLIFDCPTCYEPKEWLHHNDGGDPLYLSPDAAINTSEPEEGMTLAIDTLENAIGGFEFGDVMDMGSSWNWADDESVRNIRTGESFTLRELKADPSLARDRTFEEVQEFLHGLGGFGRIWLDKDGRLQESGKATALVVKHNKLRKKDAAEKLIEMRDEAISQGAEGLMIREPGSQYEVGRSKAIRKVKAMSDADAVVIGHYEGSPDSKNEGRLGGLIVENAEGRIFKLGGMSDDERERWEELFPLGTVVEYSYLDLSKNGNPKHASFLRLRPDLSPSDLTMDFRPDARWALLAFGPRSRNSSRGQARQRLWGMGDVNVGRKSAGRKLGAHPDGERYNRRYGRMGIRRIGNQLFYPGQASLNKQYSATRADAIRRMGHNARTIRSARGWVTYIGPKRR